MMPSRPSNVWACGLLAETTAWQHWKDVSDGQDGAAAELLEGHGQHPVGGVALSVAEGELVVGWLAGSAAQGKVAEAGRRLRSGAKDRRIHCGEGNSVWR